ncbi:sacsin-like, partial [Dendronephthya gigantea]|uniref:sacsin-like n=1 Tax=Dendronephthya gigantea TaxID=151771 RepID=UPI001069E807
MSFLNSDALFTLEKLYTDLGVRGGQNVTQFYVKYVFENFTIFTRESQMKHLQYIKDSIFPSLPQGGSNEKSVFLTSFKKTPCIPDENGKLHVAADFFDPSNELFKVMFADDLKKFPPPPFDDSTWLQLLRDIGLQVEVTPQLFLRFCETVSEKGKRLSTIQQSRVQSKELVKCLFSSIAFEDEKFLYEVSQIKFVAAAKAEEKLTSIHEQYQCQPNNYTPFIEFRDAVPWNLRFTSWSTVPILPEWAHLNDIVKLKKLGVACSGPQYNKVIDHLQNIVSSSSIESVDGDLLKE